MKSIINKLKEYDWLDILYWLAVFILAFFFGCSISGCTTQNKVQNWNNKHPELAAQYCADKFPAKDSVYTIDSVHFDTLFIEGEPVLVRDSFFIKGDTIVKVVEKACPRTQTITKTIRHDSIIIRRDRAQEIVLEAKINALQQDTAKLKAQITGLKEKVSGKNKLIWWLIIALALSVAWNFRKVIARLIVPIIPPL